MEGREETGKQVRPNGQMMGTWAGGVGIKRRNAQKGLYSPIIEHVTARRAGCHIVGLTE